MQLYRRHCWRIRLDGRVVLPMCDKQPRKLGRTVSELEAASATGVHARVSMVRHSAYRARPHAGIIRKSR